MRNSPLSNTGAMSGLIRRTSSSDAVVTTNGAIVASYLYRGGASLGEDPVPVNVLGGENVIPTAVSRPPTVQSQPTLALALAQSLHSTHQRYRRALHRLQRILKPSRSVRDVATSLDD